LIVMIRGKLLRTAFRPTVGNTNASAGLTLLPKQHIGTISLKRIFVGNGKGPYAWQTSSIKKTLAKEKGIGYTSNREYILKACDRKKKGRK